MAGGAQGASGSNFPQGGGQKANNPQFSMPTFGGYGGGQTANNPQFSMPVPNTSGGHGGPWVGTPTPVPNTSGGQFNPYTDQTLPYKPNPQGPQGQNLAAPNMSGVHGGPAGGMPPQLSQPMPMPQDARFQQNPGMTLRVLDFMQRQGTGQFVQGNPNSMPVQRMARRDMMGSR